MLLKSDVKIVERIIASAQKLKGQFVTFP